MNVRDERAVRPLRVAMIGLKGLPGVHGGVERHVEELGARLVTEGLDVTAYVRPRYTPTRSPVRGVKLRVLPTIHTKHLDAPVHTLLSCLEASLRPFDVIHIHGIGPALFAPIPRIFGKRVVVTMHSRDYLRSKWGAFARFALRLGERVARAAAHRVIAVSRGMAEGCDGRVDYIPNGVPDPIDGPATTLETWRLEPGRYLLYAGRISPEKGPHHLLRAFAGLKTDMRLALVGGPSHVADFEAEVARLVAADPRVVAPGYVDAAALSALYTHAAGFVLSSEHEGLPVAMLEAMSHGAPVVAVDIPAAREVGVDDDGRELVAFAAAPTPEAIGPAIEVLLSDPTTARERAARARAHVLERYRWDAVAACTTALYRCVVERLDAGEAAAPCPLCGRVEPALEYRGTRSGTVVRCRTCGMVYSASRPPAEDLPGAFTDAPAAYRANAEDRLRRLANVHRGGGRRLLDVGCYDGRFAGAAQALGYDASGVEPVAAAAERARRDFGLRVFDGTLETADLPARAFDVVSFIHVFEHLADPRASLARCRDLLADGGALLIEIPAYDAVVRRVLGRRWRQFISDHDRFYTGDMLRRLLAEEGFRVLDECKVGKVLTPALLADRLGRYYSRGLGRTVTATARALGILETRWTLNLGDIRLVVADRRP